MRRSMLNRSLYVGTITNARLANASPVAPDASHREHQGDDDCNPGYNLARFICPIGEGELYTPGACWKVDTDERVIHSPNVGWLAVHRCAPARIIVLGYDE